MTGIVVVHASKGRLKCLRDGSSDHHNGVTSLVPGTVHRLDKSALRCSLNLKGATGKTSPDNVDRHFGTGSQSPHVPQAIPPEY
jgi:hypothetical protein